MTRESVIAKWESLTPRERDAWVAEVVFDAKLPRKCNRIGGCLKITCGATSKCLCDTPVWLRHPIRAYTTNISAAWTVADQTRPTFMRLLRRHSDVWYCSFTVNGADTVESTAEKAICLAALIAKLTGGGDLA